MNALFSSIQARRKNAPEPGRRRWFRFGPGTVLALIIAAAVVASGQLDKPRSVDAGRIVYEADSQGKLQKVERPTEYTRPAIPALWKPTPDFLLEHGGALNLTKAQASGIRKLAADWRRERDGLQREIDAAAQGFGAEVSASNSERRLSTRMVTTGLGDYSFLSQQLNERREARWQEAVALLNADQSAKLHELSREATRPEGTER